MRSWPELYCPFESKINVATESANARTIRWASDVGLITSEDTTRVVNSERYTWLVGRFFPDADEEVFQLIADWTSWVFWHDDECDETALGESPRALAALFNQFMAILENREKPRPSNVFEVSLRDIAERLQQVSPDRGWYLRLLTSVRDYFDACVWEAANRVEGVVPSVGSFIPLRRCAGGMWIYLDFVELVNRRSLPLSLRKHRDVQRLVQITQNVACWHNDIFSLDKELKRGDVHNLVITLQAERGGSMEEALAEAVAYADSEVHAFVGLRGKLPRFLGEETSLPQYVAGLESLMRGNLDWSLESARYSPLGHRDSDIRELRPSSRAKAG